MGVQWASFLVAGSVLVSQVAGLDLAFVAGANCTGDALYGTRDIGVAKCLDLSDHEAATSVHMMNFVPGQTITFFSDAKCTEQVHQSVGDGSQCLTQPAGHIRSFKVDIDHEAQPQLDSSTTDLVPYQIKLSDYSAMGVFDPNKDLSLSLAFLAVGIASAAGGAVTIYNTVNGCSALYSQPNPPNAFACLGTPIAFILAYVGGHFKKEIGAAVVGYWNARTGTVTNVVKRELIDGINADFMHGLHADSAIARHVGFAKRDVSDGIEQTSPVYEIDGGEAGLWHVSAFVDEDAGQFIHHIRPANISDFSEFAKRDAPYSDNSIRWSSGGFDVRVCQYKSSSAATGYGVSQSKLYNTFYDQMTCLHNNDYYGDAKSLDFDLHNESGGIVGEVVLVGYRGSSTIKPSSCSSSALPVNGDCQVQ